MSGYASMSIVFRLPRKCTIVGEGIVTFGVCLVIDFSFAALEFGLDPAGDGDALELLQEVGVKERPAKLAVGDAAKPDAFLLPGDVADVLVLDAPEIGR